MYIDLKELPERKKADVIAGLAEEIRNGALIVYPTDTVYGIGASLWSDEALKRIYAAKDRAHDMPLILLVDSVEAVAKVARIEAQAALFHALTRDFWPGALTLILEKKDNVPDLITAGGKTVGVRMPDSAAALAVISAAGGIFPTTSANISGEETPNAFSELSEILKKRADILIDDGKCPVSLASTIVDISRGDLRILRQGSVTEQDMRKSVSGIDIIRN
ncbi:MAG: threonylcarbamoyl-AMP synthase [Fusobacteriaceae bacterium]|nr:threonylcarbamoyl-AMP synthase [Fusobacteriaceae bacterium]